MNRMLEIYQVDKKEICNVAYSSAETLDDSYTDAGEHLDVSYPYGQLLGAFSSAKSITRHVEFYRWLQNEICDFIPHQVLLTAWGDFENGDISYDVASVSPGINTRFLTSLPDLDELVSDLYRSIPVNGIDSHVLHHFDDVEAASGVQTKSRLLKLVGASMKALLGYRMRDERDNQDCLYVFCSMSSCIEVDPLILGFLMPHIDATLRRVECLAPEKEGQEILHHPAGADLLSEREQEVINWVGMGKSNQEIGSILGISHNTVKNHLKRVFRKMDVTSRSQAVHKQMRSRTRVT
jgi:transcriptional regulator EpsA